MKDTMSYFQEAYDIAFNAGMEDERTRIIKALEGLRAEIIEKIIGDYDEALSLEEIGYLTKDRVKQLKDKWL